MVAETNGSGGTTVHKTLTNVPLWIDNAPVESGAELQFQVKTSTEELLWTASGADAAVARRAVDSAAAAFPAWAQTPPTARRRLVLKLADVVAARRADITEAIMAETGAQTGWANGINLDLVVGFLEELASGISAAETGLAPPTSSQDRLALVVKQPYGVVLGIAPWNAPFILAMRAVATPIACGNTAVLKASELSPRTHHFLAETFAAAGFPAGVLNVVQHSRERAPEVMEALIAHPAVRKVNFTGSTAVGKLVAQQAGLHLKPLLMELGGKAPLIVLADADLDAAAQAAVVGGYLHVSLPTSVPRHALTSQHGQICMATERVIVVSSVLDAFMAKLKAVAAGFDAGRATSAQGAEKTQGLVAQAVKDGARLAHGSNELSRATLRPTILTDVPRDTPLFYAESFGPTLTVHAVASADEALRLANDTEYGLSASIFSRDVMGAMRLARRLDSGAVHINGMTVHDEPGLPHGGYKSSGYGRFGARWGLDEFLQLKTITVQGT
ncbi:MAG: hypothetical protein M1832_005878 [Thelocarpon impressellum]|nr:MAG: hypothetical protein M1832_005878 [Thelocarpon impressellum]